jgi:hypothetical protein
MKTSIRRFLLLANYKPWSGITTKHHLALAILQQDRWPEARCVAPMGEKKRQDG